MDGLKPPCEIADQASRFVQLGRQNRYLLKERADAARDNDTAAAPPLANPLGLHQQQSNGPPMAQVPPKKLLQLENVSFERGQHGGPFLRCHVLPVEIGVPRVPQRLDQTFR